MASGFEQVSRRRFLSPMAGGMKIAPAGGAGPLTEAGATARILVFGNGVKGSGPVGFQKSVTDTNGGDPAWSPFWDFLWQNEATPPSSSRRATSSPARAPAR